MSGSSPRNLPDRAENTAWSTRYEPVGKTAGAFRGPARLLWWQQPPSDLASICLQSAQWIRRGAVLTRCAWYESPRAFKAGSEMGAGLSQRQGRIRSHRCPPVKTTGWRWWASTARIASEGRLGACQRTCDVSGPASVESCFEACPDQFPFLGQELGRAAGWIVNGQSARWSTGSCTPSARP